MITRLRQKIEADPKILNICKQLEVQDMFYGLNSFLKEFYQNDFFIDP